MILIATAWPMLSAPGWPKYRSIRRARETHRVSRPQSTSHAWCILKQCAPGPKSARMQGVLARSIVHTNVMALLERELYLEQLQTALNDAAAGCGRLVLISGEAGIGKTSLVEQFTRQQTTARRVLWGACDDLFTPRPLGPLHDMAAQTQSNLSHLLHSNAPHATLFSTFLAELQGRPLIAIFEDMHWADEASLDLVRYLGRRIGRTSALVILSYRDDELALNHPLRHVLGDLPPSPTTYRIQLPPLSAKAIQMLIGERPIQSTELHHQTGGNPFFVTEVLANSTTRIPPTVHDAVLARVSRLSAAAQAVLQAAALIGPRIEPWLLAEVTGEQSPATDETVQIGLLRPQGDLLIFRHELTRQTILSTIPPQRHLTLNRQILTALQASPLTRQDLARLTYHAEAAGDGVMVLACAPTAAQQANEAGSKRAAAALYELATRYADALPLSEQAELHQNYSLVCDNLDWRPQAIVSRREAARLWREAGHLLQYGECLGHLALLLHLTGHNTEAEAINDEAITVLEGLPPNRELAIIYNSQALLHLANLENAKGVAIAEKNLMLAQHLEDDTLFPRLYETLGLCWLHLDYVKGIHFLEESLGYALNIGQVIRAANAYANLSSVYVEFHQFPQAERCFAAGLVYMAERDMESTRLFALAWRAQWHLLMGRWADAAADIQTVLELPGTSIGSRGPALMVLGRLRARQGEPHAITALDESLTLMFKLGYRQREGMIRAARAEAAWLAEDKMTTLSEARNVYEQAVNQKHPWVTGELAYWRWCAGDEIALPDWVAEPYRLQIQGEWDRAAAAWERLGCPYEQARALADGSPDAQLVALDIFDRLGAQPAAEMLRHKMRQTGIPNVPRGPRPSTRENPFSLTTRQREILALLAQNHTNPEIAAQLHLSTKTVDNHVSAILAKMAVHTREDAAALARQHHLL